VAPGGFCVVPEPVTTPVPVEGGSRADAGRSLPGPNPWFTRVLFI
jgi:hypothetical protein